MTTVKFIEDLNSGALIFEADGHAGFTTEGYDPVCAGVSTLGFTLSQYIEFIEQAGGLLIKPEIKTAEGRFYIRALPTNEYYAQCMHSFFVIEVGFHVLAFNYPDNITLIPFASPNGDCQ